MGGIVATEEVGKAFEADDHYTTFGPNNVMAMTTGLKVIEIIEKENLIDNAEKMGDYFINKLKELKEEHGFVGDVRGRGLFIGIEIVKDKVSKVPDAELAKKLKQGLQERGVLASITGNYACVIRLTPPLTINKTHIDQVIEALRGTIKSL